jgi:hypothetical protein
MKSLSESSSVVGTPSSVRISAITVFDNISLSASTPSKSKIRRCFKFYVERERCFKKSQRSDFVRKCPWHSSQESGIKVMLNRKAGRITKSPGLRRTLSVPDQHLANNSDPHTAPLFTSVPSVRQFSFLYARDISRTRSTHQTPQPQPQPGRNPPQSSPFPSSISLAVRKRHPLRPAVNR